MAATAAPNGAVNDADRLPIPLRFSDVPAAIDVPVTGPDGDEDVEVNLEGQLDDPTELCQLLENERSAKNVWITIALAYAKQGQIDHALDILDRAQSSLSRHGPKERLSVLTCIAWMNLLKSRRAPRVATDTTQGQSVKTKDHYLRETTTTINEALRINPAFPPLYLTRGMLNLLKAALTASTKTGQAAEAERSELLRNAQKCFDDALKASDNRNMMAAMGKARTLYQMKQYGQSLQIYQNVLSKMPSMTDPDPRIGIGCCFWQLGFQDSAKAAWQRAVALQPDSKAAHALLGVYYLHESSKHPATSPEFQALYKKAMMQHLKKAFDLDKQYPFTASIFSTYFLLSNRPDFMEPLARMAIERTDVNAIASDGWFNIARQAHNAGDSAKATDAYNKADQARGGMDKGYWPAKFGTIQIMVESQDLDGAKFRIEKIVQGTKSVEAMTLLGCIYAEEVFAAARAQNKEDKSAEMKKAITLLENVRKPWQKDKMVEQADETVLLYLARLYEQENLSESAKCLQAVHDVQMQKIPPEEQPQYTEDKDLYTQQLRELLPPQLLNNLGCFYYSNSSFDQARQTFEIALNACVKLNEKQEAERKAVEDGAAEAEDMDNSDTDALVTTISFNLARTYESLGQKEEAQKVYEGLLLRHSDYTEASARLAFMALQDSPQDQGPRKVGALYSTDYSNVEVRSLMGWYYRSSKRKTTNIAEDQEYRLYKHTLQGYDKHDLYSLTGMGNIHLTLARDMPRNNDAEKEKRSKMYQKAYEFFDKALQLDSKNAYAAQGVAIALCEDKKNYSEALQILTKVKDTVRDTSVHINLGHVYAELRQFQRSIDNYEVALRRDSERGSTSALLLSCLSRVWLLKGKNDKSILALNTSLDYMKRALATQPESPHLQFNVAFIQFQVVQLVNSQPETGRTLEDVNAAKDGLEEAIATFESVAKAKNPPYPRSALEQRAAMSKGTMRKQLERSHQQQSEYERANATRLEGARLKREEEIKRREEAKKETEEKEAERIRKLQERREKENEELAKLTEKMRAEALAREAVDYTTDEETGDKVKRQKKKPGRGEGRGSGKGRKRDREVDDFIEDDEEVSDRSVSRTPISADEGSADEGGRERKENSREPKKKRRKLERKGGKPVKSAVAAEKPGKFKSAAVVVDSDSEEEPEAVETPPGNAAAADSPMQDIDPDTDGGPARDGDVEMGDERNERAVSNKPAQRKRKTLRTIADDDEDDDEEDENAPRRTSGRIDDDDD